MKYLTKKESKKTFFEGKEVELVNYVPETPIEALYFLQPPPEPTFEGQIKQLIIKMFLQIEAEQNKRLQYHFSPHEFMKIQGVDENMKTEMLRKLRETLSYFPEDKVIKHLEAIREYIETFTPFGLPPQTVAKRKPELIGKLITIKNSETIERIHSELKGYFPNKEAELLKALQGEQLGEILLFPHNQNKFVEVFRRLKYNGYLLNSDTEIMKWICSTFQFIRKGFAEPQPFNENTVWNNLNKGKGEPTKKERICFENVDWLPYKSPKQLEEAAQSEKL